MVVPLCTLSFRFQAVSYLNYQPMLLIFKSLYSSLMAINMFIKHFRGDEIVPLGVSKILASKVKIKLLPL